MSSAPSQRAVLADAVKKCWSLLDPAARRRWVVLIPIGAVALLLEAVGAALIFSLIEVVSGDAAPPKVVAAVIGEATSKEGIALFAALVFAFYGLKTLVLLWHAYAVHKRASEAVTSLSTRLLRGYLFAPYAFHLHRKTGDLLRNVNGSPDLAFRNVLVPAVSAVVEVLLSASIIAVLLLTAPMVTLGLAVVLGGLLFALLRATQRRFELWGQESNTINSEILTKLQQSFDVVKELKVLGREELFVDRFHQLRAKLSEIVWHKSTLEVVPRLLIETLFVLGVALLIGSSAYLGNLDRLIGVLGLFAYAGFRILPSIHRTTGYLNLIRFGVPAVEDVYRDYERFCKEERPSDSQAALSFQKEIKLDGVSYQYEDGNGRGAQFSLSDIDLVVSHGSSVGIVGTTGAGKTTLVDLILGLLEPTEGRIVCDDVDIKTDLRDWQKRFGYVPQTACLVDDTLMANITLGVPGGKVDEARVKAALEISQLGDLVGRLPEGLETVVGERGVRLSGGERQRISIARAVYHDPEILVFDEATSALDHETEKAVSEAIDLLRQKKTLLVVAHRFTTVKNCDRIIRLEGGRVVADGTFEEVVGAQ